MKIKRLICKYGRKENRLKKKNTVIKVHTSTHRSWKEMMNKCYNNKHTSYKTNGAVGITVVEKWKVYEGFLEDMGEKPEGCLLFRYNKLANFSKVNCIWLKKGEVKGKYHHNRTHGLRCGNGGKVTSLSLRTWYSMIERCTNKRAKSYYRYGGRGIIVCDRWLGSEGFSNFSMDMGERPKGMTLDRIDNDGNYEPSNCRWATSKEQARNKSDVVINTDIAYKICVYLLHGISHKNIGKRFGCGKSIVEAIAQKATWKDCMLQAEVDFKKVYVKRKVTFTKEIAQAIYDERCNGEKVADIVEKYGCKRSIVYDIVNGKRHIEINRR